MKRFMRSTVVLTTTIGAGIRWGQGRNLVQALDDTAGGRYHTAGGPDRSVCRARRQPVGADSGMGIVAASMGVASMPVGMASPALGMFVPPQRCSPFRLGISPTPFRPSPSALGKGFERYAS